MKYLAIDTANKFLTVILCDGDKTYAKFEENCGVNHSIKLMPGVEELVLNSGFDLKDVDFFACNVGAGSFTGIRIGVSTVKAMCLAYNKPCLKITTFDTMVFNKDGGKYLAVINAGHGSFYVAGYENNELVLEPCFIGLDGVLKLSEKYGLLSFENIEGLKTEVVDVLKGFEKAIENKMDEVSFNTEVLTPLYIRKSQAEEGR